MAMSGFFAIPASLILVIMPFVPPVQLMQDSEEHSRCIMLKCCGLGYPDDGFHAVGHQLDHQTRGNWVLDTNTVQSVNWIYDLLLLISLAIPEQHALWRRAGRPALFSSCGSTANLDGR
jgi:hypothetical protein